MLKQLGFCQRATKKRQNKTSQTMTCWPSSRNKSNSNLMLQNKQPRKLFRLRRMVWFSRKRFINLQMPSTALNKPAQQHVRQLWMLWRLFRQIILLRLMLSRQPLTMWRLQGKFVLPWIVLELPLKSKLLQMLLWLTSIYKLKPRTLPEMEWKPTKRRSINFGGERIQHAMKS